MTEIFHRLQNKGNEILEIIYNNNNTALYMVILMLKKYNVDLPALLCDGKNPVRFLNVKDKKNHNGSCIHGKM